MPAQVAWQPYSLRGVERPAPSPSDHGSGRIAGLNWLPDGQALAVMDQQGNLSFFDAAGRFIPFTLPGHSLQVRAPVGQAIPFFCLMKASGNVQGEGLSVRPRRKPASTIQCRSARAAASPSRACEMFLSL